ncbi:MAG: tetratricopeptide repeat protein, partial [Actinomycetia bacterium]|nr:tetratricopeptide repeat protein [Actinomycetes bacterium]
MFEVHRLAVAGREAGIAVDAGGWASSLLLGVSRFREVVGIAEATLGLGDDPGAFYHLGYAQRALGRPHQALGNYQRALTQWQSDGNQQRVATALTSIGSVYNGLGDRERALDFFNQALAISREVGDRAGEATT